MRTALGAPLQNISENILNRVISKNIQADLRKYKMSAGARRGDRATSNGRERTKSPAARRDRSAAPEEDDFDIGSLGDHSKEISHYLSSLNTSSQNKISLLRM